MCSSRIGWKNQRSGEGGRCGVGHRVSFFREVGNRAFCGSVTLDVCNEWVSVTVLLLEVHIADLHEALDLVTSVNEGSTCSGQGPGLVAQLESLLRGEHRSVSPGYSTTQSGSWTISKVLS